MRPHGSSVPLFICSVWLALFGDGIVFGVIALSSLSVASVLLVREQHRVLAARRDRRRA